LRAAGPAARLDQEQVMLDQKDKLYCVQVTIQTEIMLPASEVDDELDARMQAETIIEGMQEWASEKPVALQPEWQQALSGISAITAGEVTRVEPESEEDDD
jgi:hypothetical protein